MTRDRIAPFLAALTVLALAGAPAPLVAQEADDDAGGDSNRLTSDDYARAERLLGENAGDLVSGILENDPVWLEDGDFWYRVSAEGGHRFVLVEPDRGSHRPAFDHARLAAALSVAADTSYTADRLPFDRFEFREDRSRIRFRTGDSIRWSCGLETYDCAGPDTVPPEPRDEVLSPDGRWAAFVMDENLYVRSTETGDTVQLSTEGTEDHGFAVEPEGCCSEITSRREGVPDRPILAWSPDSERILTHRLDERGVGELHLLETQVGRPELHSYKVGLPGDSVIPTFELYLFDVPSGTRTRVDASSQPMVNSVCCGLVARDSVWKVARWSEGGEHVFFTRGERSFDRLRLYRADPSSGAASLVVDETTPTYAETSHQSGGLPNWRPIRGGEEVLWWSERSGWGHLYRYDASSGELLNPVTSGQWLVHRIVDVDPEAGWVTFTGMGREAEVDRYFRQLYRARLDGGRLQRLTGGDFDHAVDASPEGRWLVDRRSRPDSAPVTRLLSADGEAVRTLERADDSELRAEGWEAPVHFTVRARDGETELHGYLYFPPGHDPAADTAQSFPVVDYIYPGPQTGPIGLRSWEAGSDGGARALAQLGFVVFTIDALGTPYRSKAFHDAYYGEMGDNGIPDHVTALKQLARRYPAMDLDRVGIYGHSGGGFSSTGAFLRYPDFFDVAVSSAGNHDNRSYDYTWGEKYQGLLRALNDSVDTFSSQANHRLAEHKQGDLLLMYGTLDDNVHPNATLLLIRELIDHGLDHDVLVYPNGNHGFDDDPYVIRRRWDYFVEHLKGQEPPASYRMEEPGGEP